MKERFHSRKETRSQPCRACFLAIMDKVSSKAEKHARIATGSVTGTSRPFRLPDYQDTGSIFLAKNLHLWRQTAILDNLDFGF